MAHRKNVITPTLAVFLDAASELNHSVCFSEHERKRNVKRIATEFEKLRSRGFAEAFITWNCLAISHARQPGPRRLIFPGPGRTTSKEAIVALSTELAYRQNAFAVSMLYELVERYISDLYGVALNQAGKPVLQASQFRKSETKDGRKPTQKGTPHYYAAYARWSSRREISEALNYLTATVPWGDIHRGERFGLEYVQLAKAVAYCRNLIVHRYGRLPSEKPPKAASYCWTLANQFARKEVHGESTAILPDADQTKKLINEIASFAFAAYVAASEHYGFAIDYEYAALAESSG